MNSRKTHWTRAQELALRYFASTTLFCFAIAILLWVLGLSRPFGVTLGISLCIGWSILAVHMIAGSRLEARLGFGMANAAATALGLVIASGILYFYLSWLNFRHGGFFWSTATLALFFGVLGTIVFTNMARVHKMREDLSRAELQRLATERALTEAKLKTLQAQIEPHFLFNTLTSAMGLIHTQPLAAEETLLQLTKLLRNALSRTRKEQTTVAEELSLIEAYLHIAKLRMGDRLDFDLSVEDELKQFILPPMLVQPLVENALTHGLEPAESEGKVEVDVSATAGGIAITVTDNGLGLEGQKSINRGINRGMNRGIEVHKKGSTRSPDSNTGLRNIRDRLQQLYGDRASLKLTPNSPSGVVATLLIPAQGNLSLPSLAEAEAETETESQHAAR